MVEVRKDHKPGEGAFRLTKVEGESPPPFEGREREEEMREPLPERERFAAEERLIQQGKVPLHPAAVRLPASIAGRIGFELTGYNGFVFTEQELNDLAELWAQCGIMMSPILQASIATTAMTGAKFIGYFSWVKAGKPPLPGAKEVGKGSKEEKEEE